MRSIKLLGLSALALSLMAFAASAAQATTEPPEWMINGADVTLAKTLEASVVVQSLENNSAELLVQVGSIHVLITCTAAQLTNAKTLPHGKLTQGFATFTGCSTKLNGEAAPKCETHSPGDPVGTIISEEGTGQLKLVGGVPVTELTSVVEGEGGGSLFAVIEMGEKCSIGEFVEVEGSLTVKDCKGLGETEATTHLIEEGPGSSLVALNNPAKLIGSAILTLGGTHATKTWSGLAG
ncbi:MAG: hypothetical protein ACREMY_19335 [bacterium]